MSQRQGLRNVVNALLGLGLRVSGAQAQSVNAAGVTDLSQLVVSADALGEGWSISDLGPDNALVGFIPAPADGHAVNYRQAPLRATVGLYQYANRSSALASLAAPNSYWGNGNTTTLPLTGYGDGPSYRAYGPGIGANSGITFVVGAIDVYVSVDGFDSEDNADALANQLASAEDALLQASPAADNSTLIIAESYASRLEAFDIAPDGGLANRRV